MLFRSLYFYFIQTFKLIELTDLNFAELVRLMMVDDDAVLIYFQAADEMVNMIIAQRAYEMNSKAITASDEMLQQANNLRS